MPNLGSLLKAEMMRLARKATKPLLGDLKKDAVRHRKAIAELKRRVAKLEQDAVWLVAEEKRRVQAERNSGGTSEVGARRITSRTIVALRRKLGVTQAEFGKLVGVSSVAVNSWEHKGGPIRVREVNKAALARLKGFGRREVQKRLELV